MIIFGVYIYLYIFFFRKSISFKNNIMNGLSRYSYYAKMSVHDVETDNIIANTIYADELITPATNIDFLVSDNVSILNGISAENAYINNISVGSTTGSTCTFGLNDANRYTSVLNSDAFISSKTIADKKVITSGSYHFFNDTNLLDKTHIDCDTTANNGDICIYIPFSDQIPASKIVCYFYKTKSVHNNVSICVDDHPSGREIVIIDSSIGETVMSSSEPIHIISSGKYGTFCIIHLYSDANTDYYMIHHKQLWDSSNSLYENNVFVENNISVGHTNTDTIASASSHTINSSFVHKGRLVKSATTLTATTGKSVFQIPFSNVICDTSSGSITLLVNASSTNGYMGASWNFFKTHLNNRVEIKIPTGINVLFTQNGMIYNQNQILILIPNGYRGSFSLTRLDDNSRYENGTLVGVGTYIVTNLQVYDEFGDYYIPKNIVYESSIKKKHLDINSFSFSEYNSNTNTSYINIEDTYNYLIDSSYNKNVTIKIPCLRNDRRVRAGTEFVFYKNNPDNTLSVKLLASVTTPNNQLLYPNGVFLNAVNQDSEENVIIPSQYNGSFKIVRIQEGSGLSSNKSVWMITDVNIWNVNNSSKKLRGIATSHVSSNENLTFGNSYPTPSPSFNQSDADKITIDILNLSGNVIETSYTYDGVTTLNTTSLNQSVLNVDTSQRNQYFSFVSNQTNENASGNVTRIQKGTTASSELQVFLPQGTRVDIGSQYTIVPDLSQDPVSQGVYGITLIPSGHYGYIETIQDDSELRFRKMSVWNEEGDDCVNKQISSQSMISSNLYFKNTSNQSVSVNQEQSGIRFTSNGGSVTVGETFDVNRVVLSNKNVSSIHSFSGATESGMTNRNNQKFSIFSNESTLDIEKANTKIKLTSNKGLDVSKFSVIKSNFLLENVQDTLVMKNGTDTIFEIGNTGTTTNSIFTASNFLCDDKIKLDNLSIGLTGSSNLLLNNVTLFSNQSGSGIGIGTTSVGIIASGNTIEANSMSWDASGVLYKGVARYKSDNNASGTTFDDNTTLYPVYKYNGNENEKITFKSLTNESKNSLMNVTVVKENTNKLDVLTDNNTSVFDGAVDLKDGNNSLMNARKGVIDIYNISDSSYIVTKKTASHVNQDFEVNGILCANGGVQFNVSDNVLDPNSNTGFYRSGTNAFKIQANTVGVTVAETISVNASLTATKLHLNNDIDLDGYTSIKKESLNQIGISDSLLVDRDYISIDKLYLKNGVSLKNNAIIGNTNQMVISCGNTNVFFVSNGVTVNGTLTSSDTIYGERFGSSADLVSAPPTQGYLFSDDTSQNTGMYVVYANNVVSDNNERLRLQAGAYAIQMWGSNYVRPTMQVELSNPQQRNTNPSIIFSTDSPTTGLYSTGDNVNYTIQGQTMFSVYEGGASLLSGSFISNNIRSSQYIGSHLFTLNQTSGLSFENDYINVLDNNTPVINIKENSVVCNHVVTQLGSLGSVSFDTSNQNNFKTIVSGTEILNLNGNDTAVFKNMNTNGSSVIANRFFVGGDTIGFSDSTSTGIAFRNNKLQIECGNTAVSFDTNYTNFINQIVASSNTAPAICFSGDTTSGFYLNSISKNDIIKININESGASFSASNVTGSIDSQNISSNNLVANEILLNSQFKLKMHDSNIHLLNGSTSIFEVKTDGLYPKSILVNDGSVTNPSYGFYDASGNTVGTGIYLSNDFVCIGVSGNKQLEIGNTSVFEGDIDCKKNVLSNRYLSDNGYIFSDTNQDTGMYLTNDKTLTFKCGGETIFNLDSETGIQTHRPLVANRTNQTSEKPSIVFGEQNDNTGLHGSSLDVSFSVNGSQRFNISSDVNVVGSLYSQELSANRLVVDSNYGFDGSTHTHIMYENNGFVIRCGSDFVVKSSGVSVDNTIILGSTSSHTNCAMQFSSNVGLFYQESGELHTSVEGNTMLSVYSDSVTIDNLNVSQKVNGVDMKLVSEKLKPQSGVIDLVAPSYDISLIGLGNKLYIKNVSSGNSDKQNSIDNMVTIQTSYNLNNYNAMWCQFNLLPENTLLTGMNSNEAVRVPIRINEMDDNTYSISFQFTFQEISNSDFELIIWLFEHVDANRSASYNDNLWVTQLSVPNEINYTNLFTNYIYYTSYRYVYDSINETYTGIYNYVDTNTHQMNMNTTFEEVSYNDNHEQVRMTVSFYKGTSDVVPYEDVADISKWNDLSHLYDTFIEADFALIPQSDIIF